MDILWAFSPTSQGAFLCVAALWTSSLDDRVLCEIKWNLRKFIKLSSFFTTPRDFLTSCNRQNEILCLKYQNTHLQKEQSIKLNQPQRDIQVFNIGERFQWGSQRDIRSLLHVRISWIDIFSADCTSARFHTLTTLYSLKCLYVYWSEQQISLSYLNTSIEFTCHYINDYRLNHLLCHKPWISMRLIFECWLTSLLRKLGRKLQHCINVFKPTKILPHAWFTLQSIWLSVVGMDPF